MNLIQPGSFLTLHYRLAGPDGADVVNTFNDKPATLSLGTGQLAPAMEQRLIGLAEGARWVGGSSTTPAGVVFQPNMPTEAVLSMASKRVKRLKVQAVGPTRHPKGSWPGTFGPYIVQKDTIIMNAAVIVRFTLFIETTRCAWDR